MRSGQNPNIDDDTRERARRFVEKNTMSRAAAEKQLGLGEEPSASAVANARQRLGIGSTSSGGVNEKEYRSDPYSAMTKAELDSRSDGVDEFFVGAAADMKPRAKKFVEDADIPRPAVTANPKPPVTNKTKAPIVTKKMLADSGFDNLRDYLNAQRGLTRRSSPKPKPFVSDVFKRGGKVSSASKRADGIAIRGKTRA